MGSYTVLTVFENTDTLNEPVISIPLAGRISFRQIGFLIGLSVMAPLFIYSGVSSSMPDAISEPVFSFNAVNTEIRVTWDMMLASIPIPLGLLFGMARPKLVPMDVLLLILLRFMIYHSSVRPDPTIPKAYTPKQNYRRDPSRTSNRHARHSSRLAGFAAPYPVSPGPPRKKEYTVAVTELGIPKNITVTLYDTHGNPMRNRLARAYIDDMLQCSITTDSDGTMGMTFVPHMEGKKRLCIMVDGMTKPTVDAVLEITKSA